MKRACHYKHQSEIHHPAELMKFETKKIIKSNLKTAEKPFLLKPTVPPRDQRVKYCLAKADISG